MSSHGRHINFLKKIEEDTLRTGELRIPRSFVNKCWEGISNPLLLLLPNGAEWKVNWKKLDADVWLIDDWKKFAECCSLDQNHLLVFKHLGQSRFRVVIFDQSGLEMEYPLMEPNVSNSPLPFSPSSSTKKVKTNQRVKSRRTNNRGRRGIMHANKSKTIKSEGNSAFQRANDHFRSDNPFFVREMAPSYIRKSLVMFGKTSKSKFITELQLKEEDSVTLQTSEDRSWVAKFCRNRCNGQISLTSGWQKFVTENNLKTGDACVFEQIKSPEILFKVHIYRDGEESTCEDGANRSKETGLPKKNSENGNVLRQSKRERSPLPVSRSTKKVKTNPRKEPASYPTQEDIETRSAQYKTTKAKKRGERGIMHANMSEAIQSYGNSAIQRAHAFRSDSDNPLFIREVQPSYIKHRFMAMPINFISEDQQKDFKSVTFWSSEEKSWHVNFYPNRISNQMILGAGWGGFVKDNNLKIGNACVFEKIEKPGLSFRVVIFRDQEEPSPSKISAYEDGANGSKKTGLENSFDEWDSDGIPKKNSSGRRRAMCSKSKAIESEEMLEDTESGTALERAKAFRSDNPLFIREMEQTCIQNSVLLMPGDFITEEQQKEGDDHVSLWISEEKSWHVKFYPKSSTRKRIMLSTGWMEFVKDNNLKIGNVCVFEQIKKTKISFRVVIFRDREESSPSKFPDSEIRRCNNEMSENHLTLLIKSNKSNMIMPMKFVRNHEMENAAKVMLRVGNGSSWPVRLDHYPKHSYCKLSHGWSEFMSEYKLKPGDACNLELVDKDTFVFQVRIARCIID